MFPPNWNSIELKCIKSPKLKKLYEFWWSRTCANIRVHMNSQALLPDAIVQANGMQYCMKEKKKEVRYDGFHFNSLWNSETVRMSYKRSCKETPRTDKIKHKVMENLFSGHRSSFHRRVHTNYRVESANSLHLPYLLLDTLHISRWQSLIDHF